MKKGDRRIFVARVLSPSARYVARKFVCPLFSFAVLAFGQTPLVRIVNTTHPASRKFQVGDRFEVLITGAPNQPVSVRTGMQGRSDWGPVIGTTDSTGRWSVAGQFEKSDFGDWSEIWTVGNSEASPAVQFSVDAPCLPDEYMLAMSTGRNMRLICETSDGRQSFSTPSDSDSFRTPDGRSVPGRPAEQTQDAYQMHILEYLIGGGGTNTRVGLQTSRGGRGDGTAGLILQLIGVNALSAGEIRNVLTILRAAFEKPGGIAPGAKNPVQTQQLLQRLTDFTDDDNVLREIAETTTYVQTRQ